MLAKRIIPTLLVRGRTLVKGERFDSWRSIGHAAQAARVHAMRGVDELCILDIAATKEGWGPDLKMVSELSEACFIPITVGGGVRRVEDIDALLRAGADKVCIGAAAGREFLLSASSRFGRQAIVVSLDVRYGDEPTRQRFLAQMAAMDFEDWGAGEILLQCVERDGTMVGYDLDLIRAVSAAVNVPVIASGGCGTYAHMLEAFKAGADACAAGAMFAFTDQTPRGAAAYLKSQSLEVRV